MGSFSWPLDAKMTAVAASAALRRPRSDSESAIFSNSWHHHSKVPKSTIIEDLFDAADLVPSIALNTFTPRLTKTATRKRKDTDGSNSRSELADSSEADESQSMLDLGGEMPDESEDADEVVGPIHPRKNQDVRSKYKEITYMTNPEGRRIIEAATLEQLIRTFAEETQGTLWFPLIFTCRVCLSEIWSKFWCS